MNEDAALEVVDNLRGLVSAAADSEKVRACRRRTGHSLIQLATACTLKERNAVSKKRVFVSFDFDNDKTLKDFLIGQARLDDSPFDVADHSLKEAQPEKDWENKARAVISRSDVFIVMLGPKTKHASGVLKEVKMARDLDKPHFQIIGYRDGDASWAVPGAGRTYRWGWDNLKKLLA